ncbi:MAG: hypothetical protein ACI9MU_001480, partial [Alphaproteobacteria bacterium]
PRKISHYINRLDRLEFVGDSSCKETRRYASPPTMSAFG